MKATETTLNHRIIDGILIVRPTRADVQELKVGDLAPTVFGDMHRVVEIYAQRDNIHGRAFVLYYTESGPDCRLSGDMVEGEPVATIPAGSRWLRTDRYPQF